MAFMIGYDNVAIGHDALQLVEANNNIMIGYNFGAQRMVYDKPNVEEKVKVRQCEYCGSQLELDFIGRCDSCGASTTGYEDVVEIRRSPEGHDYVYDGKKAEIRIYESKLHCLHDDGVTGLIKNIQI